MSQAATKQKTTKQASYDDLYGIPENMIGEIVDGELIASPRPSLHHAHAGSLLGGALVPPYGMGSGGGPGGWLILDEPEIYPGDNVLVPDLAGWRKERLAGVPASEWMKVPPDWVCEILSPSTARIDKVCKMPLYARYGVLYCWLLDPAARTLDFFRLESGRWVLLGSFVENDRCRAEPFMDIELELGNLWLE